MMETAVFYESDYNTGHFITAGKMNNINQLKRKMTLNLDIGGGDEGKPMSVIKKAKVASLNTPQNMAVLSSPDLNMLKLASPELERLIIQQTSMLPTPTPTQTQIFFPKNVTEEQELYVQGFTDALSKLRNQSDQTGGDGITTTTTTTSVINSNNNNIMNNTSTHNNIHTTAMAIVPQPTTITTTSSFISNNHIPAQLLQTQQQLQHQLQLIQQQHQQQKNTTQTVHPPSSYYEQEDSSDVSEDTMSESSCSNSTTSSSTYTTNGHHVTVPTSSIMSLGGHHRLPDYQSIPVSAATMGSHHQIQIKDEPQTVPSSSPPVSPIDMASQEKIKLERKRQRNRVAASKCRKRKLERISKLEDKVKILKGENSDLTNVLSKLKETVCHLKQQVMEHVNSGCQIMINSNSSF